MVGMLGGTTRLSDVTRGDAKAMSAPTPNGGMEPEAADGEEQPNVSPEEQAQYDQFVDNGYSLIFDERMLPKVLERLKAGGDPVDGVANVAAMTVLRLEESAQQAGKAISPDVMFHAGAEFVESLAEASEKARIHSFTPEEMESAMLRGVDLYRQFKQQRGELNPEPMQEDFAQLMALDEAGKLDELFPGLASKYGGGKAKGGGKEPAPAEEEEAAA